MADNGIKASVYSKDASIPWCDSMLSLKSQLEDLLGVRFDYCLLNLYRTTRRVPWTGQDYISYHSDNEATEGKDVVASISLGATRRFLLRNKITNQTYEFSMTNGYLIVMSGEEAQTNWISYL
jgi:alkylated DNA repair dioxygenase AlkB